MKKLQSRKFDYSWVIIILCFMMGFICLGFCSSGRSLYLTAITDALHFPRGAFSVSTSIRFVTTAIINLFFGALVQKFGTKKLICAGLICLIGFAIINSVATTLFAFYVGGVLLGLGLSWTGTTMISSIMHKWCKKNVGTYTGAVLAGNGIGGAVAVQLLSPIIFKDGDPFGYRTSYQLVSLILLVFLILMIIFFKDKPKVDDSETVIFKKEKKRTSDWEGIDFNEALKKPYFYLSLLCIFLIGMSLQGLGGISTPHMYDIGMDVGFVATITSIHGLLLAGCKFLTGYIYDKKGINTITNICLISMFLSLFMLIFLDNSYIGKILALIRIVFGALSMPLETVMISIFAMELFGNKSFDKFVGIFISVRTAGFAIGSPFGNLCYDILGNYKFAFLVFAILIIIVSFTLHIVLRAAKQEKQNSKKVR